MTTHRSSKQDAADSTAEMAVQVRPLCSTVKALQVRPVAPGVIRSIIEQKHYLHSMPAVSKLCFGVYLGESLEGAVVFTSGPRQGFKILEAAKPQDVSVLARLWLSDALPKNSESRVIGYVLRYIRHHTTWKLLLSYADPLAGHSGTIYQATGWYYLGQTEANSYISLDGKIYHPRTIYNRYGSNSLTHLKSTGVAATRHLTPGKYRYVYLLNPSWKWRLRQPALPYPKNERQ